ncbi:MAG: hypothetical protein IIA44_12690, partial [Acidobacteria bacterium]|nr:hypothetical protein [Acidobacteriota bacterium]
PPADTEDNILVDLTYPVRDFDGESTTGTLTVDIDDDSPVANIDTNTVQAGMVAHGDVAAMEAPIINGDVVGGDLVGGVADAPGADGFASISWQGQSGSTVTGTFGTLTVGTDGTYSYDLNDTNATVVALADGVTVDDVFTYTIVDGDGDTSTTTLTITITGANDGPTITGDPAEIRVSEEGLPGGNQDTVGNQDTTNSDTGGSTVTASDPDGDTLIYTLSAPVTALASNLVAITWTGDGTNTLIGKAGATTIITISINGSGVISVDLDGPLDHTNATEEDDLSFLVGVTVADGNGKDDTTTVTITVEDDSPVNISPDAAVVGSNSVFPTAAVTEDLDFFDNVGADRPGDVTFSTSLDGATLLDDGSTAVLSNGSAILLDVSVDGHTLTGFVDGGGDPTQFDHPDDVKVFTIELNPDATNEGADEYTVTLFDKMDTGAILLFANFQDISPGGPQDFIALDDPRTGADDLNEDVVFTANPISDKLNNSTQGSGVADQQVDASKGDIIRIDFVSDVVVDGTPVDDANPAVKDDFALLDYDAHYTVNNAGFIISQSFGPATVTITAFDADDDLIFDNDDGSTGNMIADVQDTITSVSVKDETGAFIIQNATANTTGGGVSIVFNMDGTVTVSGLLLNYQTLVSTADGFNRIEIAADVEKWDFGGAVVSTDSAGEPIDMDFAVVVEDEDLDTATGTIEVTVLPQQIADPGGETLTATANGSDLLGGAGIDTLIGGDAADKLQGGGGADIISDGTGNDIIIGGDEADAITLAVDGETDFLIYDAI